MPVAGYLAPAVASIMTGSLVVESIAGLPGVGRYLVQGALNRDYTLVLGMVILYSSVLIGMGLMVDLAACVARSACQVRSVTAILWRERPRGACGRTAARRVALGLIGVLVGAGASLGTRAQSQSVRRRSIGRTSPPLPACPCPLVRHRPAGAGSVRAHARRARASPCRSAWSRAPPA